MGGEVSHIADELVQLDFLPVVARLVAQRARILAFDLDLVLGELLATDDVLARAAV